MKIRWITIFMIFFWRPLLFNGQTQYIVLETGPLISRIDWNNSVGQTNSLDDPITGFEAGLGWKYRCKSLFEFEANCNYIRAGGSGPIILYDFETEEETILETETFINCVGLNMLAQARFRIANKFFFNIGTGPQILFLTSFKEDIAVLEQFKSFGELASTSFYLFGSINVGYEVNRIILGLGAEYTYPLSKLVDYTSEFGATNTMSLKYYGFYLKLGYCLNGESENSTKSSSSK